MIGPNRKNDHFRVFNCNGIGRRPGRDGDVGVEVQQPPRISVIVIDCFTQSIRTDRMRNPLSAFALGILALAAACSTGPSTPEALSSGSSSNGSSGATGSTATSGTASTSRSGSAISTGATMSESSGINGAGTSGSTVTGASGATMVVSDGATLESGPEAGGTATGPIMSPGCGLALPANITLGKWTDMADPGNGNPPPITVDNVDRGYWVYVPPGYDGNKPYKVIYQGAGCGASYPNGSGKPNLSGMTNSNQPVWPFQNVDMGQAIQVGVDYGFNPARPNCFDDQNPQSNDFKFFPVLKKAVESMLCIDTANVFLSGYSTGSWWVNQMTCGFGEEIRGTAEATGGEPPQPTCVVGAHIASLFLHDINDQLNTYQGILPACLRALKNNGCTTMGGGPYTACDPSNVATTAPWPIPPGLTIPGKGVCIQFDGCPADSPVVFCTTTNADVQGQNHYEFVNSFIAPLFWNLFSQF
jgi:hypothetical protein